jgi:Lrp/AsnC family transcriptional regulator, leucine-responsive regulatory protein
MTLDRTDIRLLSELQQDGRRTVVELAETVGLTHTPCARRVRQLEQAGVIQGYTAVVDPARLGLTVQAFVQVRLERHTDENIEQFHRALDSLVEVVGCFATTGAHDFMLQIVAADLESFGTLVLKKLLKIPGVRDVQSSLVLDTLKRSARIPLSHLLPQAKLDAP